MFILAERAKTSQSPRVSVTVPSHADYEDYRAHIESPFTGARPVRLGSYPISRVWPWAALLLVRHLTYIHTDCSWYEPSLKSVDQFSCRIADGVLHISWYDHEGIITITGLNLARYFDYYLALLFILQRFDRSTWGRLEDGNLGSDRNGSEDETIISVEDKEFTFNIKVDDNVLRKPLAIGGRATSIYRAQIDGDQAPRHVIKFNWKESIRQSERFILQEIQRRVQDPEFMKQNSLPIDPGAGEVFDESDNLLSYLPEVVAGVETNISTKMIRDDLGVTSHPRQLVVIVFMRLDGTIRQLEGEEYWQVVWDCLRCEFALCPLVRFSYKRNRS